MQRTFRSKEIINEVSGQLGRSIYMAPSDLIEKKLVGLTIVIFINQPDPVTDQASDQSSYNTSLSGSCNGSEFWSGKRIPNRTTEEVPNKISVSPCELVSGKRAGGGRGRSEELGNKREGN